MGKQEGEVWVGRFASSLSLQGSPDLSMEVTLGEEMGFSRDSRDCESTTILTNSGSSLCPFSPSLTPSSLPPSIAFFSSLLVSYRP